MTEQKRPLIVELEEAKIELTRCVNDILWGHGLNCYLFEPIIADVHSQIKAGAQNELAQAKTQMKAAETAKTVQND